MSLPGPSVDALPSHFRNNGEAVTTNQSIQEVPSVSDIATTAAVPPGLSIQNPADMLAVLSAVDEAKGVASNQLGQTTPTDMLTMAGVVAPAKSGDISLPPLSGTPVTSNTMAGIASTEKLHSLDSSDYAVSPSGSAAAGIYSAVTNGQIGSTVNLHEHQPETVIPLAGNPMALPGAIRQAVDSTPGTMADFLDSADSGDSRTAFQSQESLNNKFKKAARTVTTTVDVASDMSGRSPYGKNSLRKKGGVRGRSYSNSSAAAFGLSDVVDKAEMKLKGAKIRQGRYIIGDDTLHVKKYLFIPSAYLEQSTSSFEEVFQKLKLDRPTTLFRILQASDTDEWNVRLPPNRSHLAAERPHAVHKKKSLFSGGGMLNTDSLRVGHKVIPEEGELPLPGVHSATPTPRGSIDGFKLHSNAEEPNHSRDLKVEHYKNVLRENCKRFLKESCRALSEVGACVRMNAAWASDTPVDYVAEWIKDETRDPIPMLGIGNIRDYHPDIWAQFEAGSDIYLDEEAEESMKGKEIIIDPEPFYNGDIEVYRDPETRFPYASMPHPGLTHLILTDNPVLLERKLATSCPSGLIMLNGSHLAGNFFCDAILKGQPVILFKYTGYTTDVACEMLEKAEKLAKARRKKPNSAPERPFPDNMEIGYHHPSWLDPFDEKHLSDCNKMNVLIENFPHRFNPASVFIVDLFQTSGDDLQDKITQTMSVVFAPPHELGGNVAEAKRLSFAWRLRLQCIYNSRRFKIRADYLNFLLILFIFLSTISAVWITYIDLHGNLVDGVDDSDAFHDILDKTTLLLPLIATILRGLISILNPYGKYIALKNATAQLEGEIYRYRCKVGKYSTFNPVAEEEEKSKNENAAPSSPKKQKAPREHFAQALDTIWKRLAASDISNGSLSVPPSGKDPLHDINKRIRKNKGKQKGFFEPLVDKELEMDAARAFEETQEERETNKSFCATAWRKMWRYVRRKTYTGSSAWRENITDYGISAMSVDDYIYMRLVPTLAELSTKTPGLSKTTMSFTVIAMLLSVSASALSTFNLAVFIPAALALAGALTSWGSYNQVDITLNATNSAIHNMSELLVWWEGLTLIEKRVPKNKDRLVMTTEQIIEGQATVLSGVSIASSDDSTDNGD